MIWGNGDIAVPARRKRRWTLLQVRPEAGGRFKVCIRVLRAYQDFFGHEVDETNSSFTPEHFFCAPQARVDAEVLAECQRNKPQP